MSRHAREAALLGQIISYDDTAESHSLRACIIQAHKDECCIWRAVWLTGVLVLVGAIGLGYWQVLLACNPKIPSRTAEIIARTSSGLGLGGLVSWFSFVCLGAIYRKRTRKWLKVGWSSATKILDARMGQRNTLLHPAKEQEISSKQ